MNPNTKARIWAVVYAHVTAIASFINWVVSLPPEQQSGILGQLVALCPPSWAPAVGFWTKTIASLSAVTMVYKATHSGPSQPPSTGPSATTVDVTVNAQKKS